MSIKIEPGGKVLIGLVLIAAAGAAAYFLWLRPKMQESAKAAKVAPDDKAGRIIVGERLRTLKTKADTLPKLEQRRSLLLAQAESLVGQIESINTQARTSGVAEASALLDVQSIEGLAGQGYDEVSAAAEVRGMLTGTDIDAGNQQVWADLRARLGTDDQYGSPPRRPASRRTSRE